MAKHRVPVRTWAHRALAAWVAVLAAYAAVVAAAGAGMALVALGSAAFLGATGVLTCWSWMRLFDVA